MDHEQQCVPLSATLSSTIEPGLYSRILQSHYFIKFLKPITAFEDLVVETVSSADCVNAWTVEASAYKMGTISSAGGSSGGAGTQRSAIGRVSSTRSPSRLWSCVVRLAEVLQEESRSPHAWPHSYVTTLTHHENPYVRFAGFLMVRLAAEPAGLRLWFSAAALRDGAEVVASSRPERVTSTLGAVVTSLLERTTCCETRLPRLPPSALEPFERLGVRPVAPAAAAVEASAQPVAIRRVRGRLELGDSPAPAAAPPRGPLDASRASGPSTGSQRPPRGRGGGAKRPRSDFES